MGSVTTPFLSSQGPLSMGIPRPNYIWQAALSVAERTAYGISMEGSIFGRKCHMVRRDLRDPNKVEPFVCGAVSSTGLSCHRIPTVTRRKATKSRNLPRRAGVVGVTYGTHSGYRSWKRGLGLKTPRNPKVTCQGPEWRHFGKSDFGIPSYLTQDGVVLSQEDKGA